MGAAELHRSCTATRGRGGPALEFRGSQAPESQIRFRSLKLLLPCPLRARTARGPSASERKRAQDKESHSPTQIAEAKVLI